MDKLIREAERSGDTRKLFRLRLRIDPETCPKCQMQKSISVPHSPLKKNVSCCCVNCHYHNPCKVGTPCTDCPYG